MVLGSNHQRQDGYFYELKYLKGGTLDRHETYPVYLHDIQLNFAPINYMSKFIFLRFSMIIFVVINNDYRQIIVLVNMSNLQANSLITDSYSPYDETQFYITINQY